MTIAFYNATNHKEQYYTNIYDFKIWQYLPPPHNEVAGG